MSCEIDRDTDKLRDRQRLRIRETENQIKRDR